MLGCQDCADEVLWQPYPDLQTHTAEVTMAKGKFT